MDESCTARMETLGLWSTFLCHGLVPSGPEQDSDRGVLRTRQILWDESNIIWFILEKPSCKVTKWLIVLVGSLNNRTNRVTICYSREFIKIAYSVKAG